MSKIYGLICEARNQLKEKAHQPDNVRLFKLYSTLVYLGDMYTIGHQNEVIDGIKETSLFWSSHDEKDFPALKTLRTIAYDTPAIEPCKLDA